MKDRLANSAPSPVVIRADWDPWRSWYRVSANPDVLRWAREQAGYDQQGLAHALRTTVASLNPNTLAFVPVVSAWWAPYRELVSNADVHDRVYELSESIPDRVTLLRRIDVALWMAGGDRA